MAVGFAFVGIGALAATYYVDGDAGSDDNDGLSSAPGASGQGPWATIGKANATLKAGDEVQILAGTYADLIRPAADGTADDARITYRPYGDGEVVLTGNSLVDGPSGGTLALGEKRFVTVSGRTAADPDEVRLVRIEPQRQVGQIGNVCGSTGVVVENIVAACPSADRACNRGFAFCIGYWGGDWETQHNVLRNSVIDGFSTVSYNASEYTEDLITIAGNAHHNLIENNVLRTCRHSVIYADAPASYANVIRNNTISNTEHTALSIWSAGVDHADGAAFLVEGNFMDASGDNDLPTGGPGNALQWGSDELIIRHNVIARAGAPPRPPPRAASSARRARASALPTSRPTAACTTTRWWGTSARRSACSTSATNPIDLGSHVFANNVIHDISGPYGLMITYWDEGRPTGDRYVANVFGNPGGSETDVIIVASAGWADLPTAKADFVPPPTIRDFSDWRGFENRYLSDPGFVDAASDDYTPAPDSPLVDAAAPLTEVAEGDDGASDRLAVADARPFYAEAGAFPAWMGVRYDTIAVGPTYEGAAVVALAGVDDDAAVLTLARAVPRSPGDGVWLVRGSDGIDRVSWIRPRHRRVRAPRADRDADRHDLHPHRRSSPPAARRSHGDGHRGAGGGPVDAREGRRRVRVQERRRVGGGERVARGPRRLQPPQGKGRGPQRWTNRSPQSAAARSTSLMSSTSSGHPVARSVARELGELWVADLVEVGRFAELVGEHRRGRGDAQVGARLVVAVAHGVGADLEATLDGGAVGAGGLVAHAHRREPSGRVGREVERVDGGDLVASADLAGVDRIVAEVVVGDVAVLVAEQAVVDDGAGIEVDLDLHVLGDDLEGGGHLLGRAPGAPRAWCRCRSSCRRRRWRAAPSSRRCRLPAPKPSVVSANPALGVAADGR